MIPRIAALSALLFASLAGAAFGQRVVCIDGQCHVIQPLQRVVVQQGIAALPSNTIVLNPLQEEVLVEEGEQEAIASLDERDRFDLVIRATVRVTISGVCGSGTVVGRDQQGNALVLTNAHVAGTTRGRTVNLERWNTDGSSERGTGTIIASGYGRGMGVDFALLRCSESFAKNVTPIPLADRYPSIEAGVTTFGCPRCEWPSLQVLKLNRSEGQILSWKPEAIGGRSGSSLVDYTDAGPRVVGLLTWAGGGEGLGQSTPFLLNAMRGRLPATLEALPPGTREVFWQDNNQLALFQVPATTSGQPLNWPAGSIAHAKPQDDLIDSILERPRTDPKQPEAPQPDAPRPLPESPLPEPIPPLDSTWSTTAIVTTSAVSSVLLLLGLQYGIPLLLQVIRQFRSSRGGDTISEDHFQQLLIQYRELLRRLELVEQSTRINRE
jgi:hypothetical protein